MEQKELIQRIAKIEIESWLLSKSLAAGAWKSAFKGRGMEFEGVRDYHEGDDIRTIDWNVTARMRRPHVKMFAEERELTVYLVADISASLKFGSGSKSKRQLMAEVGGALAFSAVKNGDRVGLILFSDQIEHHISPGKGRRHVQHLLRDLLLKEPASAGSNLSRALDYFSAIAKKSCICFFLSDFLAELPLTPLLVPAKKHDLIAIAIGDPWERDLPNISLGLWRDLESGQELLLATDMSALGDLFRERSRKRAQDLRALMARAGAGYISVVAGESYKKALHRFFTSRTRTTTA